MVGEVFEPIVHELFEPSTKVWQYVVADPTTNHSVIIDPVFGSNEGTTAFSSSEVTNLGEDGLLSIVRQHGYRVDMILETFSSPRQSSYRSGAWSLRMQLLDLQGYAPRVTSGAATAGFQRLFARKYATAPQKSLADGLPEGEPVMVGQMSVTMLKLPGLCTPNGTGYTVGRNIFGAHSTAQLKTQMAQPNFADRFSLQTVSDDECHDLWISLQRILGLPADYRLYFDRGIPLPSLKDSTRRVRFDGDELGDGTAEFGSMGERKDAVSVPFTTVAQCRTLNSDINAMATEFMATWTMRRCEAEANAANRRRK